MAASSVIASSTLLGVVIGSGAGCCCGAVCCQCNPLGCCIGTPVGAVVGGAIGFCVPAVTYSVATLVEAFFKVLGDLFSGQSSGLAKVIIATVVITPFILTLIGLRLLRKVSRQNSTRTNGF